MSEELPWFKAYPSQWLGGDIMYLSKEDKGSFIDACFHYWNKDCSMTYIKMARRITQDSLDLLIDEGMIEKKDNQINIKFLDIQYQERKEQYIKRVKAAKKPKKTIIIKNNNPYLSTSNINKFIKNKSNDT
tara:strand:+ start:5154 stop:5546 length:393 start_codon:yes stop_codon:yes gene_type:complete